MKQYILIVLIGIVAAFIGIIPLLKRRSDGISILSCFAMFFMMPYIVQHFNLSFGYSWMKGMIVSSILSLPLIIALGKGSFKMFLPLLTSSILVGLFITFVSKYLL